MKSISFEFYFKFYLIVFVILRTETFDHVQSVHRSIFIIVWMVLYAIYPSMIAARCEVKTMFLWPHELKHIKPKEYQWRFQCRYRANYYYYYYGRKLFVAVIRWCGCVNLCEPRDDEMKWFSFSWEWEWLISISTRQTYDQSSFCCCSNGNKTLPVPF